MSALWVVVPAFNEAKNIHLTLEALAAQQDRDFTLVVVDNDSTDTTAEVVRSFGFPGLHLVTEQQKGTGAAADTGMRYAIRLGATHLARTDADCLPDPDWTRQIKESFAEGLELVAGALWPRREPDAASALRYAWVVTVSVFMAVYFTIRHGLRKDPDSLGPFIVLCGGNMAVTADLYERAGGFPRLPIEEAHDDYEFCAAVRRITTAYGRRGKVRVRCSLRRVYSWGLRRCYRWYSHVDRGQGAWVAVDAGVDVR